MDSSLATPFFSKALNGFAASEFPALVSREQDWVSRINEWYHVLCDSVHTRGEKHSNQKENSFAGTYNGIPVHRFDEQALLRSTEKLLNTVALISFLCAIMNPISLFGLPMGEKFGLNPPASGFLNEKQSARLRKVIHKDLIEALIRRAEQSEICISAINWVNSLPDLSEEELSRQNAEFDAFLESNRMAQNIKHQEGDAQ